MTIDRIAPTRRPPAEIPPQGYHKWRTLLFLHWEVPAEVVQKTLPRGLTVDTFEGRAFVGLVPFTMTGIRPTRLLPPVPGVSAFHETNVRTYVHAGGKDPGVWFYSLDAASSLAVRAARRFFYLPYFRAEMALEQQDDRVSYRSTRLWPEPVPATLDLAYTIGERLGPSPEGTLLHFLAERYFLYSTNPRGELFRGQVHHAPYDLRRATVERVDETMMERAGFPHAAARDAPDLFCPGVDVEVFGLSKVEG
jgi:uncharacterized protein YqjF (DUF2071 family)